MTIFDYIDKNKDLTFDEKSITEIDKFIFSLLSYVNYEGLVSRSSFSKKSIEEVGNIFFENNKKEDFKKNLISIKVAVEVLDKIRNTKRYKDLLLYNDIYIGDEDRQFSAICIQINPKLVYVSFEGTDHLISGWEEDFRMLYKFPVLAQKHAIQYLNRHFTFRDCKIIIGGHSKGGNLALVSSMYANKFVANKILEVYSYDGPGLRKEQLSSDRYDKIKPKFKHIIPSTSVVGLMLWHTGDHQTIKSNRKAFFSHIASTWLIEDDNFINVPLSNFSVMFGKSILIWQDKYDERSQKLFFDYLFEIFKKLNIVSLTDIMEDRKLIIKIVKETKNLDSSVKDMFKEFMKILVDCHKEYLKNKIENKFN